MAAPRILTYQDAIAHAARWVGGGAAAEMQADLWQAVLTAYDELAQAKRWNYYARTGMVELDAAYSTGTITYDDTGGTFERELTLASGTWPTNAAFGKVRISGVTYHVATRESDTVVTLEPNNKPVGDIAAGTTYEWFRDTYTLPTDFRAMDMPANENSWWINHYMRHGDLVRLETYNSGTSQPWGFTVIGDPDTIGGMALYVYPPNASNETMKFAYIAHPRQLVYSGKAKADTQGTVTATSGSATVEGTNTSFDTNMAGSIIRLSSTTTTVPEGLPSVNRFAEQYVISSVTDSDTLVLDRTATTNRTGVKYSISDPVDIEQSMIPAFLRGIEYQVALCRNMKSQNQQLGMYEEALRRAKSVDGTRVYKRQQQGGGPYWRRRLGVPGATPTDA